MSFQLPSENGPFYKRFFMKILLFIQFFVGVMLLIVVGIVIIGIIVMLCGMMLGLIPNPTINTNHDSGGKGSNKESQANFSNSAQAVDEKTRVEIEMGDVTSTTGEIGQVKHG